MKAKPLGPQKEAIPKGVGRRLPRWFFLLVFVVSGGIFVGGYGTFRDWRAHTLAKEAQALIEAGNWKTAWERIRAARHLEPENRELLKAAAGIAERADPPQALELWRAYQEGAELSLETITGLRGECRTLAVLRSWDELKDLLDVLEAMVGPSPFSLRLHTRAERALGNPVEAAEWAWQLSSRNDLERDDHWFIVSVTIGSPRKQDNDRARRYLERLALEGTSTSLAREALERFCMLPQLSEGERDFAIRRWASLAETREQRLLALELRLKQLRPDVVAIVAEARGLFDLSEGREQVVLGRWFNQRELYRETLSIIPEGEALKRHDLYLVRLDALALLDQWDAVKAFLGQQRAPLRPFSEHAFRMRSHYELGETTRAGLDWDRAVQEARGDAQQLRFLARYAERLGLRDFTVQALWAMVEVPGVKRVAYYSLLSLFEGAKETEEVSRVLAAMKADYPYDYAVLNDWAYYQLLTGRNLDEALRVTDELVALNPDQLSHRMNIVLARLKVGNFASALAYAESLPVADWRVVKSQRWRSLVAVCLLRNDRRDMGELFLVGVEPESLMPEELALLQAALQS